MRLPSCVQVDIADFKCRTIDTIAGFGFTCTPQPTTTHVYHWDLASHPKATLKGACQTLRQQWPCIRMQLPEASDGRLEVEVGAAGDLAPAPTAAELEAALQAMVPGIALLSSKEEDGVTHIDVGLVCMGKAQCPSCLQSGILFSCPSPDLPMYYLSQYSPMKCTPHQARCRCPHLHIHGHRDKRERSYRKCCLMVR